MIYHFNFLLLFVADFGTPALLVTVEGAAELEVLGVVVSAVTDATHQSYSSSVCSSGISVADHANTF